MGHGHGDHDHSHGDPPTHDHDHGRFGCLRELLPFGHSHSHSHGEANVDAALEGSAHGIRAIKVSLLVLGATTLIQAAIYVMSGSVALLADTLHNFVDAVNGVPLWIALVLSRRAASRRYTYGYGRAEDVTGLFIVGLIFVSALLAGYETFRKFVDPEPLRNIGWVLGAAVVGFLGNETEVLWV